jgi:competence protein ComEC
MVLLLTPNLRRHWPWALAGALLLFAGSLIEGERRDAPDELRCTFVAVGHGGCTVMEMPDGRVVLYDVGSLKGPDVTRWHVAPFLWHRRIRRIDELILSHADLDHFNGIVELMDRFAIGQVTCTPTFAEWNAPGVPVVVAALAARGVPLRVVSAGDRLDFGDVTIDVLHPQRYGPSGRENFRSLTLVVRHAGHALMLTGDLEGPGLTKLLDLPLPEVDVLMAPHHGSRAGGMGEHVNRVTLLQRTKPKAVIACQQRPRGASRNLDPYRLAGVTYYGTWPHGAITVRSRHDQFELETYATKLRQELKSKGP